MKQKLIYFSRYLPFFILVMAVCIPLTAYAGMFGDVTNWAVDKASEAVASALGIDTDTNCVPPREHSICLFCDMFKVIFNACSKIAHVSYNAFHSDLGQLVAIFFGVSIALIVLKNVASFGSKDPGALMNDIATKLFVCAAFYILITKDYYNVLNLTIVPVLKDGLSLVGLADNSASGSCSYTAEIRGFVDSAGAGDAIQGGLPKSIGEMIVCAIDNIEGKINNLFEYGKWAFCRGFGPDRILHILPHPVYIIDGLLFYLGGIFFMVVYPWVLADAVIQLGISMALMPFAVAAYAFNGTKNYLSKAFSWILNSLFVFIFMAILLLCMLDYINDILNQATSVLDDPKELFTNPNAGLAFYGPNMVMIMFVLMITWLYMPLIKEMAAQFAQGAKINAATALGTVLTQKMEDNAGKVADYAKETAGDAAQAVYRSTKRRTGTLARHAAMGLASRFGHDDGAGRRTFNVGGTKARWLTRGLSFTKETDANGNSVLIREFTSLTGRKHVMISDKYSTLKQEYTASGKLVKSEVHFKHGFIEKHLLDSNGNMNIGAIQTLLDSPMGQNPAFRKELMSQIAVKVLEAKGKKVGTYFLSRDVVFDPDHPEKIFIVQKDHSGKVTKFSMDINMQTGQTAVSYTQQRHETQPISNMSRKLNMSAQDAFLNRMGHDMVGGGKAFDSWLGIFHYESAIDPATGEMRYTRSRKKYLFFGPDITKTYDKNGISIEKNEGAKAQAKILKKMAKIDKILLEGTPNAGGGMKRKRLFYTYESHLDANGDMVYTKRLRSGWNLKNYFRKLRHPFSKTPWVTGDVKTYSDSGFTRTNSKTGDVDVTDFLHSVTRTNADGSTSTVDLRNGQTFSPDKIDGECEVFFSNGLVDINITGLMSQLGVIHNEKTEFKYSEAAQAGHDSILSQYDGNQVVESDGSIASNLDMFIDGDPTRPNPLYLLHGMGEIAGLTDLGGMSVKDFVVDNILARGRTSRTNRFRSNIGSLFFP